MDDTGAGARPPACRRAKQGPPPTTKGSAAVSGPDVEDSDGQGRNPFMVHHARVWSRASTVQLPVVLGGSGAVQCLNSKQ